MPAAQGVLRNQNLNDKSSPSMAQNLQGNRTEGAEHAPRCEDPMELDIQNA